MLILFRQADMDTCLTGLLMGAVPGDAIKHFPASPKDLADATTLCIGVGGGGDIEHNNFDTDPPAGLTMPASAQAWNRYGPADAGS